ncbi:MAG: tyrosine-protein phosphatase [Suipraeoptans sp.]
MNSKFKGIANFRDLGGLRTKEGKVISKRRLLRCGELSAATGEDVEILVEEYATANVVDLRTDIEIKRSPNREVPGSDYISLDFLAYDTSGSPIGSEQDLKSASNIEEMHLKMEELYKSFVTVEFIRNKLNDFLQVLLNTKSGATVFHCFAGKDRTGITAAVVLTILGVSREDIMKDYLATNILRKQANAVIIEELRKSGKSEDLLEAVELALSVEKRYLEAFYREAISKYGSFEEYISNGIGIKSEDIDNLRVMYLEAN